MAWSFHIETSALNRAVLAETAPPDQVLLQLFNSA